MLVSPCKTFLPTRSNATAGEARKLVIPNLAPQEPSELTSARSVGSEDHDPPLQSPCAQ